MDFNSLFFPAPKESYSIVTHFGELLYLPKNYIKNSDGTVTAYLGLNFSNQETEVVYIPCLHIKYKKLD